MHLPYPATITIYVHTIISNKIILSAYNCRGPKLSESKYSPKSNS